MWLWICLQRPQSLANSRHLYMQYMSTVEERRRPVGVIGHNDSLSKLSFVDRIDGRPRSVALCSTKVLAIDK